MNTPRFSIIIPAYNAEGHITKALESVRSQTFKDYELIVVCDSCKDNTEELARSYGAKTFAVEYHNDWLSRSRGLDEATGEWVLFMDDDDWWLHEYVLWQLDDKIKSIHHSLDVLCFSFIFKDKQYASPKGNAGRHWVSVWNKCWRRACIGKTRFPCVKMCSDRYFSEAMMKKGLNMVDWDMPMYYYNYLREGSQTENEYRGKRIPAPPATPENIVTGPVKQEAPRYLIHTCPKRKWYVDEFLVPSMIMQGIPQDRIQVWNDDKGIGNLRATMKSFSEIPMDGQGTWHLQDDVVISKDFKALTEQYNEGLVCGFCSRYSEERPVGQTTLRNMWYSFPCIRIPNNIARECAKWFYHGAINDSKYKMWVESRKHDDEAFKEFLKLKHPEMRVYNLAPNPVNHVDYLLGGSLVNNQREKIAVSLFWEEPEIITALEQKLKERSEALDRQ